METVRLNNGVEMPLLGFGTWMLRAEACERAVEEALSLGYRLIDTAQMYDNESAVGRGLRASGVPRAEIFLITKVYRSSDSYDKAARAIDASLRALGTEYVDLLLLHEPYPQRQEMYRAIEDAFRAGKARAIGISNFDAHHYAELLEQCDIQPAVNQLECHVFFQKWDFQRALADHGTILQAWAPLASGKGTHGAAGHARPGGVAQESTLAAIGARHGKTAAQVALRFLVQRGIPIIPKTAHQARMRENAAIFDFVLSEEEMTSIRALDQGQTFFPWTEMY